ncbi:N-6 DNA methylase [Altererythrobacter marinus]|uniref:site-specific DNA-methyltransferase (adenine-specific) n=1 Tax=Pelagerythrobacter marinus TaxID=538382 RepID=A0ABW9UZ87_9SPHN|nr:type ISP restriction/modification enzyme [Pelagerythrobacter marinus]MXO68975.1 N-6 DNA methylase [Pelagerythrobacter marinus]
MDIAAYLEEVRKVHATGVASEHSYRPALRDLFASIDPDLDVINEPRRVEVGAPDFIFQRDGVARGWCEHKDIDKDVIKLKGYSKEQKERYRSGLPNLIYTNGLDFEFLRDGEQTAFITIADITSPALPARPEEFERLETHLRAFAAEKPISIRSARRLADLMAGKAKLIKDVLGNVLKEDADLQSDLAGQYKSFKANLLPNLTPGEFADIYAETITYGMFAARFHDQTPQTFDRREALELLPKSNPFLRSLFQFVAGYDLDDRIAWIVDDLAEVLRASNPHDLFEDFGRFTARNDPFIHFYEDFLAAYNPKKRKSRGVWYTPEPVVDFIVRAVDDVLKTEFGLADGLADTGKVTVDWDTGQTDRNGKPVTIKKDVHRVQILDPATGTGTFLAKAVQTIADRVKARAPGMWSSYVENDLLPRLHGFELLMASYAMCHMKLDMQLTESGYVPSKDPPRLSVWLTNALEPADRDIADLFMPALAKEAKGASEVKRQTPIMCVIGNPPYSGESANKGDHIMGLMEAYKMEPGGKEKLREKQPRWLLDDYVKFIRMSEDLIAKNRSGGVLGFITNHSYLDNPTFRGMRWHLLKTFDKIWVLDLHGNSKKKEISPDGTSDKNVFDIQQGVALIIAVRKAADSTSLAEVRHGDLWGSRTDKYHRLAEENLSSAFLQPLETQHPNYPFEVRDYRMLSSYDRGVPLSQLFPTNSGGILTARDALSIDFEADQLWERIDALVHSNTEDFRSQFSIGKDSKSWTLEAAKSDALNNFARSFIKNVTLRPFEIRKTYFTGNPSGIQFAPAPKTMKPIAFHKNLALLSCRQTKEQGGAFVTNNISMHKSFSAYDISSCFPLYLYPDDTADQADALAPTERTLNLDPKLYTAICEAAGIDPADTAGPEDDFRAPTGDARPSEIKVFDYIYGVLHSPDYRETFAEFLKIDFPRIPYPPSPEVFRHVSEKGEQLRRLHLMEPAAIGDTPYPFDGEGDNVVAPRHPRFEKGRVYINGKGAEGQYFDGVPDISWGFYIGGYQPAQKWLKDRKGRALSWDDIGHYQKIVKILAETDRIMREIVLPLDTGEA